MHTNRQALSMVFCSSLDLYGVSSAWKLSLTIYDKWMGRFVLRALPPGDGISIAPHKYFKFTGQTKLNQSLGNQILHGMIALLLSIHDLRHKHLSLLDSA